MSSNKKEQFNLPEKLARSELNLEQNAIFTVSTYRGRWREVVRQEKLPTGEVIERRALIGRTIDGIAVGTLNISHYLVFLALVELWDQAGRPIHESVRFTTLKIMNRLRIKNSGRGYQLVKKWLFNLRQIPLTFSNAFYMPSKSAYVDLQAITILSHLRLYERRSSSRGEERVRGYGEFQFDKHILESLLNNYVHPLSLDVILSFKRHRDLATLVYTYLDRCLAFKDRYEITLEKLFEHLDLSQKQIRYPADRKVKLAPVLRELEGKPLSTGVLSYCRIRKTKDGQDYKLIAIKRPYPGLPEKQAPLPLPLKEEDGKREADKASSLDLKAELLEHGLTESQAQELLSQGEHVVRLQLEALPFRLKRYEGKKQAPNKAAILYQATKENWSLPREYWEAKEREEREKRAKHYILWQCTQEGCPCATTVVKRPKEKGLPDQCPKCGSPVEILKEDYKVYDET